MIRYRVLPALVLCGLLALTGCTKNDGPKAKLSPAKGRVTYNDKPLSGAEIYFHPDAAKGNKGDIAGSSLQLDGSFSASILTLGDGVHPGAYKVTITARNPKLKRYTTAKTTPLEVEIPEAGKEDMLFELTDEEPGTKKK